MDADIQELRDQFLNREFDEVQLPIEVEKVVEYSKTCGELDEKYINADHQDFQAPPTFVATLVGGRSLPDDFPRMNGVGMDAGKAVEWLAPIRTNISLTGKSHLHDVYTKTGRSGRMVFLVTRMELFDDDGTHVANADTRTVIRERPSG